MWWYPVHHIQPGPDRRNGHLNPYFYNLTELVEMKNASDYTDEEAGEVNHNIPTQRHGAVGILALQLGEDVTTKPPI